MKAAINWTIIINIVLKHFGVSFVFTNVYFLPISLFSSLLGGKSFRLSLAAGGYFGHAFL